MYPFRSIKRRLCFRLCSTLHNAQILPHNSQKQTKDRLPRENNPYECCCNSIKIPNKSFIKIKKLHYLKVFKYITESYYILYTL